MTVHTVSPGEDLAAIRARLDLDDDAILHIGAAGAIHFDDAAEQDKYDDRVLEEAKAIRWKRNPERLAALVERNRRTAGPRAGSGAPKGNKNAVGAGAPRGERNGAFGIGRRRDKGEVPKEKGGSE
jgi:hypothetical protein